MPGRKPEDRSINDWAVRFHQIEDKRRRICTALVENSPRWIESARDRGNARFAVKNRISTGDYDRWIAPFQGRGVINLQGQLVRFEVMPNALYQLDATGELAFHQIYQTIV